MFKELLNHNQIGGKVEIGYILFDILRSDVFKSTEDIKVQCLHYSYSFGNCFNGTIVLLKALDLIIADHEAISRSSILDTYDQHSLFNTGFFFNKVIQLLEENEQFSEFFNSNTVKFNIDRGNYYLRDSHLPIKHSTIKKILINTGLLLKDQNVRSIFYINEDYLEFFKSGVVNKMQLIIGSLRKKRQLSLDRLKEQLKRQEELGLQAEIFALYYEKKRLYKHPMISQIVRVSEEYSNAGYDIESFNDTETILINRFIEVKSYAGNVSFFWSNNEIESAKDKEDQYFIYLVNREEMERPGYHPLIISNPYKNVFNNPQWTREIGQYKFFLPENEIAEN
jgi:hypothetical protein